MALGRRIGGRIVSDFQEMVLVGFLGVWGLMLIIIYQLAEMHP